MPDLTQIAPLIVPILIGLIVLRLGIELLAAARRQGKARLEATQRAWSHYTTAMFFAAFALPFFKAFLAVPIQAGPLWALFVGGLVASAVHTGWLSARSKVGSTATRTPPVQGTARPAQAKALPNPPIPSQPPLQTWTSDTPPVLPAGSPPATLPIDRMIGKWPLPTARKGQAEPLTIEQAEGWYGRQESRLGRTLTGQELAAARLRLSTLKSMLLLGQIGTSEADGDVNMVLKQAGRG